MRVVLIAAACSFPIFAWAVGGDDDTPIRPTQTTKDCTNGMVWDADVKECVAPKESRMDDDTLYRAAREFASVGQYGNAQSALAAMSNPRDDRVLTYMGFTTRKQGDLDLGLRYYEEALDVNPDNLLARSYLGQAMVELGMLGAAFEQLAEIRARDGEGGWPEIALARAIETGVSAEY